MGVQKEERVSKRKYSKISIQKRMKLVKMVIEENHAVTKVAKKLSMKLCTARIILKKYKKSGTFPMKANQKTFPQRSEVRYAPLAIIPSPPKDQSSVNNQPNQTRYPFWLCCNQGYQFFPFPLVPFY